MALNLRPMADAHGAAHSDTAPAGSTRIVRTMLPAGTVQAPSSAATKPKGGVAEFRRIAYSIFQAMDTDGNETLDRKELEALSSRLKMHLSKKLLDEAFAKMGGTDSTEVEFDSFLSWFSRHKEVARRMKRPRVRAEFRRLERGKRGKRGSGLEKEKFLQLYHSMRADLELLPPVFDIERDWGSMEAIDGAVSFEEFEAWWKRRVGVTSTDSHVMPELIVSSMSKEAALPSDHTVKQRWQFLSKNMTNLLQLGRQWGHDKRYNTHSSSQIETIEFPPCIRSPESAFSTVWDMSSCLFLLYVMLLIPLRTCFDVEVKVWSVSFFVDNIVDIFFIVDLVLNFRLAYRDDLGRMVVEPSEISKHYLRGWFFIDFLSCIPIQYILYAVEGEAGTAGAARSLKALRLVRITKMLRIARLKKLLAKYQEHMIASPFLQTLKVVVVIMFAIHLLSCLWYVAGTDDQRLDNGHLIVGWVNTQPWNETEYCDTNATAEEAAGCGGEIAVSERYLTSMYLVLNALENGNTSSEMLTAVFGELLLMFIYGAMAGLMSTVMLAKFQSEQDTGDKLKALRKWMKENKTEAGEQLFTTEYKQTMLQYFLRLWTQPHLQSEQELLDQMSPNMANGLRQRLYGPYLETIPIFNDLAPRSPEILRRLAEIVRPTIAQRGSTIIQEGTTGQELYMIRSGEVEVTQSSARDSKDNPDGLLGYLSAGAFFGELAVFSETQSDQRRLRTCRAVTDCQLCYLRRDEMDQLRQQLPELELHVRKSLRFGNPASVQKYKMTDVEMLKVIQREQVLEQNVISQFRAAKLGKLVVSEISEHLQQLSVRLAKLQGQQLTRDKQRVLEVNDATFLEQYVHLRKGPQFLVLFFIGDVNAVIEEAVAVAAQNLKIPVIKLNMMKLRALSTEYGIGTGPCLDLFAQFDGQPFARTHERFAGDLTRSNAASLQKWGAEAIVGRAGAGI